jgi:hypothetical protein
MGRVSRKWVAGGLALGLAGSTLGCPEAADVIVEQVGPTVFDFPVAPVPMGPGLPGGTLTIARTAAAPGGGLWVDSLVLTFRNVEELSGAVYKVWLMSEETGNRVPAVGTYERIQVIQQLDPVTGEVISETEQVDSSAAGSSSFVGRSGLWRHRLRLSNATMPGGAADTIGFYTHAVVSIESDPAASAPSSVQPIWFRYVNQRGTPTNYADDVRSSGSFLFGTFVLQGTSRTFASVGGADGLGGIRGREISADVFDLPIPPLGYYYAGWVTGPAGVVAMGPLTSPLPDRVSLFDADVSSPHPVVVPERGIRQANAFVEVGSPSEIVDCTSTPCSVGLNVFFVTLEPKVGVPAMGPTPALAGPFPIERITRRGGL